MQHFYQFIYLFFKSFQPPNLNYIIVSLISFFDSYSLTLCKSNRTEVVGLHDISMNRDLGVQDVATVTNAGIVDKDINMTMALQNLFGGAGNKRCAGEVKGDSAGSVSLKKKVINKPS